MITTGGATTAPLGAFRSHDHFRPHERIDALKRHITSNSWQSARRLGLLAIASGVALITPLALVPSTAFADSTSTPPAATPSGPVTIQCAQFTPSGGSSSQCPPASVYTTWNSHTYTGTGNVPTTGAQGSPTTTTTGSPTTSTGSNAAPNAAQASPAAGSPYSCTLYVGDLALQGGDISGGTVLTCIGTLSSETIEQQFWRSSWSGYRGYSAWTEFYPGNGRASQLNVEWYTNCNSNAGWYNYMQVAYPIINGASLSPTVYSDSTPSWNCGPTNGSGGQQWTADYYED